MKGMHLKSGIAQLEQGDLPAERVGARSGERKAG